jgi:hypothetical protein
VKNDLQRPLGVGFVSNSGSGSEVGSGEPEPLKQRLCPVASVLRLQQLMQDFCSHQVNTLRSSLQIANGYPARQPPVKTNKTKPFP